MLFGSGKPRRGSRKPKPNAIYGNLPSGTTVPTFNLNPRSLSHPTPNNMPIQLTTLIPHALKP